jgi:hypothetical protein
LLLPTFSVDDYFPLNQAAGGFMKMLLIVGLLLSSQISFASQLGCATTITNTVNQLLQKDKSCETITRVTLVPQKTFTKLALYEARTACDNGSLAASTWAVLVANGPQATCEVQSVVLESHGE